MADLARALNTPVPATQPAPQQPASRTPAGPDPRAAPTTTEVDPRREAKNKRDQERRKAQRAAHAKAVEAALAKKKKPKRKAKKKAAYRASDRAKKKAAYRASDRAVMKQLPKLVAKKKTRGRGRPPGSKNKPKPPLMDTVFPKAPTTPRSVDMFSVFLTVRDMMRALLPAQRVQLLAALVNDDVVK